MPAVMKKPQTGIEVQNIQRDMIRVRIVGDSSLLVHCFDAKARKMIQDKQGGKAVQKKEPKVPEDEFNRARYFMEDGRDAFPAAGIKRAICNAFRYADGMKKVEIAGALHVEPGQELVPIDCEEVVMREDTVRIGMGTTDLRYRPEYRNWSMDFNVVYNARAITAEQVINLLNIAGFGVGLGEWRPERQGQFGMFHVDENGDPEA